MSARCGNGVCADSDQCVRFGCCGSVKPVKPPEFGPARYRIVARWSCDGIITRGASYVWGPALLDAVRDLVGLRGDPLTVLRVEPVAGTQFRGTWGGQTFGWRDDVDVADYAAAAGHHTDSVLRLAALELRSPVQP